MNLTAIRENCPRARGHFDRVNEAVFAMISNEPFMSREVVEDYAGNMMCVLLKCSWTLPCGWMGSYAITIMWFDPYVYLKRFFGDTKENYILLVDEAHNLVERAREMFSAQLTVTQFKALRGLVKAEFPKLAARLGKCIKYMTEIALECPDCMVTNSSGGLTLYLMRMMSEMEVILRIMKIKSAAPRPA